MGLTKTVTKINANALDIGDCVFIKRNYELNFSACLVNNIDENFINFLFVDREGETIASRIHVDDILSGDVRICKSEMGEEY